MNRMVCVAEGEDRVWKALSDRTRRDIIMRLLSADLTVGAIAARYPMSPTAVSKHLSVLTSAGLISCTREAQRHIISLQPGAFGAILEWLELFKLSIDRPRDHLEALMQEFQKKAIKRSAQKAKPGRQGAKTNRIGYRRTDGDN